MSQRGYRNQHYVPAGYLRAWCDSDSPPSYTPYVWLFDRESRTGVNKAPKKIFRESDFYTEIKSDGSRDVSLENFLSRLESRFCTLHRRKLEKRLPLTASEHVLLCFFCAAMHARTKGTRDHVRKEWSRVLEMGEAWEQWARTATPEEKRRKALLRHSGTGPSMTLDEVRQFVTAPAQSALRNYVRAEAPIYARMRISILCTEDKPGFITSDDPVVWFDPTMLDAPPALRSPGLGSPSVFVTMPLSPTRLLLLKWGGEEGYFNIPSVNVDRVNRLTRYHCQDKYVVCCNESRESWFTSDTRSASSR